MATTCFGATLECNTRDVIQRYIYLFGIWEPNITEWIARRLQPGDVFIDIGANIGYYSLQASGLVRGEGRVFAIEASPSIFVELEANLRLNRAANVSPLHKAVADREGTLQLFRAGDENIGQSTTVPGRGFKMEDTVTSAPLPVLIPPAELTRTRLVKIDVEGGEWPVISGMQSFLAASHEELELIVEVDPSRPAAGTGGVERILEVLRGFGFKPYRFANPYDFAHLAFRRVRPPIELVAPIYDETTLLFSRRRIPTDYGSVISA